MPALAQAPVLTQAHVTRVGRRGRRPSGTPRRLIAKRHRKRQRGRPRRVAPTRRPRPRGRQHIRPNANAAPSPCEAAGDTAGDHGGSPLRRCRATGPATHTTQRECRPIAVRGRGQHGGRPRRVAPTRMPRPRARQHARPTANAAPSPGDTAGDTVGDRGGSPLHGCRAAGPPTHTTQREYRPIAMRCRGRHRGRPRRVAPTRMPRRAPVDRFSPRRVGSPYLRRRRATAPCARRSPGRAPGARSGPAGRRTASCAWAAAPWPPPPADRTPGAPPPAPPPPRIPPWG